MVNGDVHTSNTAKGVVLGLLIMVVVECGGGEGVVGHVCVDEWLVCLPARLCAACVCVLRVRAHERVRGGLFVSFVSFVIAPRVHTWSHVRSQPPPPSHFPPSRVHVAVQARPGAAAPAKRSLCVGAGEGGGGEGGRKGNDDILSYDAKGCLVLERVRALQV